MSIFTNAPDQHNDTHNQRIGIRKYIEFICEIHAFMQNEPRDHEKK